MRSSARYAFLAILLCRCATFPGDAEWRKLEAWHESMRRTPPPKKGCFEVMHPSSEWREVPCGTAPQRPFLPRAAGQVVGNGNDYSAQATSGLIAAAVGLIAPGSVVTGEQDIEVGTNAPGAPNTYSLQMNTQYFNSPPKCSGAADPSSCQGWQQVVYSNNSSGGSLFLQYWLLNYTGGTTTACPAGWTGLGNDCWMNSLKALSGTMQPASKLPGMGLHQVTSPTADVIGLILNGGTVLRSVSADSVLGLSNAWTTVEFNVFGDGGGKEAVFGPETSLTIDITAHGGASLTSTALKCVVNGFTAETNNLTTGTCTSARNRISFTESD